MNDKSNEQQQQEEETNTPKLNENDTVIPHPLSKLDQAVRSPGSPLHMIGPVETF